MNFPQPSVAWLWGWCPASGDAEHEPGWPRWCWGPQLSGEHGLPGSWPGRVHAENSTWGCGVSLPREVQSVSVEQEGLA